MFNIYNKKTRKKVSAIIIIVLVLAMVGTTVLAALLSL